MGVQKYKLIRKIQQCFVKNSVDSFYLENGKENYCKE